MAGVGVIGGVGVGVIGDGVGVKLGAGEVGLGVGVVAGETVGVGEGDGCAPTVKTPPSEKTLEYQPKSSPHWPLSFVYVRFSSH